MTMTLLYMINMWYDHAWYIYTMIYLVIYDCNNYIYIYLLFFSNANSSDFVVGGFLTPHTPKDAGNEGDSRSQSASFRSTSTSSDSGGPSVGGVDPMVGMGLINPIVSKKPPKINMDVSKNSGTPKSSILIGFSIINPSILGYHYFWKHPHRTWSHDGLEDDSPFPGVKTLRFSCENLPSVGGGNSHIFFKCSPTDKLGKMFFHFDLRIIFQLGWWKTTNQ